jgi:phospholipid-binding lipoprotein MlaA
MNTTLRLLLLTPALLAVSCAMPQLGKKAPKTALADLKSTAKPAATATDELDDYGEPSANVSDPLEKLNRGTFWLNDKLYTFLFKPISKGYVKVIPSPVRTGLDNVFDNARFPIRLVSNTLQGKFKNAGKETGKFFLNSVGGLGGIFNLSKDVPELAEMPDEDCGQIFAKWGIPHGVSWWAPREIISSIPQT